MVIELPPLFNYKIEPLKIQPIFNGEHKDVAIPYIGFTIVISAGAGIASVELSRKSQLYHKSAKLQKQLLNLQQNFQSKYKKQETNSLPEYRPEASLIDLPPKKNTWDNPSIKTPNSMTESALESLEKVVDSTQAGLPQTIIPEQRKETVEVLEKPKLVKLLTASNSEDKSSPQVVGLSNLKKKDLALIEILDSRQQYKNCRIKLPHLKQSLLAIEVKGKYYSFCRSEPTKEKLQEVIDKLGNSLNKTVITKTEKNYVIWKIESECYSKKISRHS
ncbi:MAG: TetR family transcriptional regulator [Symploca sp. SIO2E9]|nr:TetR family transcriptional regulator [Symploca sp. SIO2E9]